MNADAGREVSIQIRNNSPEIRNFVVEAQGDGLEFSPARTEIAIGGSMERDAVIRVFPVSSLRGLAPWRLHVTGAAEVDLPARFAVIPRGAALAYSTDLDDDGQPEWVLENQHARAVFSTRDGGRCLEFTWKDSDINVLPDGGALAGKGPVDVQATSDGGLEFRAGGWRRTVRLAGSALALTIEQTTPLPAETLQTGKTGNVALHINRESPTRAVYSIERPAQ